MVLRTKEIRFSVFSPSRLSHLANSAESTEFYRDLLNFSRSTHSLVSGVGIDTVSPDSVMNRSSRTGLDRFFEPVLTRLFRLMLKSGMNISSHIDKFNKLIVYLLNLYETFKDERKTMLLIGSLPNELDHLCITLIHCDTPTWYLYVRKGCHETVDFKPD